MEGRLRHLDGLRTRRRWLGEIIEEISICFFNFLKFVTWVSRGNTQGGLINCHPFYINLHKFMHTFHKLLIFTSVVIRQLLQDQHTQILLYTIERAVATPLQTNPCNLFFLMNRQFLSPSIFLVTVDSCHLPVWHNQKRSDLSHPRHFQHSFLLAP